VQILHAAASPPSRPTRATPLSAISTTRRGRAAARIRGVDDRHHLTLLCRDLSELSSHARVDNRSTGCSKSAPGPFTFILEATQEVPRRVSHSSRRTIGLRVPITPSPAPCSSCSASLCSRPR
jgi:tRNA A37 threonylcarbamoyladenosine synthetase subunit TsaC/SUA5/YrdC